MKNLNKDTYLGIALLGLWLIVKLFFHGYGFFLSLLLVAGAAVLIVSFLPDAMRKQVMDYKNKLFAKFKK